MVGQLLPKFMPTENSKKGHALEKAVGFIQETILKSDPQFKGAICSVELNKTFIIAGVRHEIDVLVKTIMDNREVSWIFECKNWKEPVGKKEVPDFEDKVKALGAHRGYLVARRLSKYAVARLKQNDRLNFVPWTDQFQSPLNNLEAVHLVHEALPARVEITWRDLHPDNPTELDWKTIKCRFNNTPVDFQSFVKRNVEKLVVQDRKENAARYRNDGSSHWSKLTKLIEFNRAKFLIDDFDVKRIQLLVNFLVTVHREKITSKFELKNQGRVFSFEIIDDAESASVIEIDIVQLNPL